MAPGPEQKRLRSAVSVSYNTPYSTRSGIGGGAPCFWHGGQGTRGMLSQLSKPHFGLPKRRGTTPQAFTAVRAAGTSGVSPPPGWRKSPRLPLTTRKPRHGNRSGVLAYATSTAWRRAVLRIGNLAWWLVELVSRKRQSPFTQRRCSQSKGAARRHRTARPPLPETRAPKMLHPPGQLPLHDHPAPTSSQARVCRHQARRRLNLSRTPTRCHPVLHLDPARRAGASRAAPAGTAVYILVVLTCTGARTRAKALAVRGQCFL